MKNRRIHVQFLTVAIAVLMLAGCEPPCTDTGLPGAWQQDFDFQIGKGEAILPMGDGGYLVIGVGSPHGAMAPNLLRTDSSGEVVWANYDSGAVFPSGMVEMDDGSTLIVGATRDQANVALLDGDGTVIWSRLLGESAQSAPYLNQLVSTSDGNLATISQSHFSLSRTVSVVKFDTEAREIWGSALDIADNDYVRALVPTADGGVAVLSNTFLRRLRDDGSMAWNVVLPSAFLNTELLAPSDDDGVVVLSDDRIACFDPDGEVKWDKAYEPTIGTEPIDFRATPDGGFVVGSSTYSYEMRPFLFARSAFYCQRIVLTQLDGNGDITQEREYGTESVSLLDAVAPTSDGGYIILGSRGQSYFSSWSFMFLLKVDGEE